MTENLITLFMVLSLAGRRPSGDGLAQAFQQSFELGLAILHPRHALP